MAFNKRTWKGRQGTGLNKFSIGGATPVTVINQPDSVTEQGDALSAGNMNDLENRIYTAFEEEATARDEADTALKAAVAKNTAEIENLKQTTGQQEITVSYPDDGNYSSLMPNKVPLSVADYAEVPRFRGKSRAWNQIEPKHTGIPVSGGTLSAGVSATVDSDGWINIAGTQEDGTVYLVPTPSPANNFPANHSELLVCEGYNTFDANANWYRSGFGLASAYAYVVTHNSAFDATPVIVLGNGSHNIKCRFICRDLTLILTDWNPADITTANIPLMVQQVPDLLKYDAYNAGSLVDTVVSGVKSVGFNICTEDWELGTISDITGETESNQTGGYWRINRYFPVIAGKPYYAKTADGYSSSNSGVAYFFYDSNKSYIGVMANRGDIVTSIPNGCAYVRLVHFFLVPRAEAPEKVSLNKSQPNTSIFPHNGDYLPYKSDTLSLSEPVTLRSAGSVAEVLDVQTGKKTRPIGSADLGDFSWSYITDVGRPALWMGILADVPLPVAGGQQTCAGGYATDNPFGTNTDKIIYVYEAGGSLAVALRDSAITNSSSFSGMMLNYELATPLSDEQVCDPVPYNFLEVEGGGTIETIQTQTPVLDNCIDVTYDIIPA